MNHKVQLVAFAVLAVAVLGFAMLQFSNSIRAPFASRGVPPKTLSEQEADIVAQQKTSDTDADGLTDYDELNLYRTSPYLEDTDSDGYTDGEEVQTNHDPNCPTGKTCGGVEEQGSPESVIPPESQSASPLPAVNTFIGGSPKVFQNFDAQTIRSLLRGTGLPQQVIDALDDITLEQLYREAVASSSESSASVRTYASSSL